MRGKRQVAILGKQKTLWKNRWVAPATLLLITVIFCSGMFFNSDGIRPEDEYRATDWMNILMHRTYFEKSIREFGQFPLWNPFVGGGYPTIQHPSDGALSPFALPVLLFGDITGIKINLLILLYLGAMGVFLIVRGRLGGSTAGAFFAAFAYIVGGWFPSMMLVGFYNQAMFHLFPLIAYFLTGAFEKPKLAIAAGLLFAVYSFVGVSGFFTIGIFCGFLALAYCVRFTNKRFVFDPRPTAILALFFVVAAGAGAVKLLGVWELSNQGVYAHGKTQHERTYDQVFRKEAFYSGPISFSKALVSHVSKDAQYKKGRPVSLEYAFLGVPWPVLILFFGGLFFAPRRLWPWLFAGGIMLALSFGPRSPIDLYRWLIWPFAPLRAISQFYKYSNYFIFFVIVLAAGVGLSTVLDRIRSSWAKALLNGAVLVGLIPYAFSHGALLYETFKLPPQDTAAQPVFYQVQTDVAHLTDNNKIEYREKIRPLQSRENFNLRRNVGTIDWYADIYLPENAVPRYFVHPVSGVQRENPGYKGEAWFASTKNKVQSVDFKANTITVDVQVESPGTLIINQNFHKDWKTDPGRVTSDSGRIAVVLEKPGRYWVTLRFVPQVFYRGLLISLMTFGFSIAGWFVFRKRERNKMESANE
jgi:hypothetical protein